ncbi:hypothetical protein [Pseudovibrio sp. WM33]|uniref:hypothetical protein n=1 Tax=Pseudovibrio sp. WM33 TaxID=1735585 RepID=UPI0007AE3FC3|nr:hypothetical protein [Pseudovibrio sp. WM33]KZL29430.1 hypothetical protein PsWM33_00005 [Pseudovibrio sp. WM33]
MVEAKHLTEDMRDIYDICGKEMVEELLSKLPGVEVKIPLKWSQNNPLALIDRVFADLLIAELPGNKIYIPTHVGRGETREAALKMRKDGMTTLAIGLELGVSERYARTLVSGKKLPRRKPVDPRQIDLEDLLKEQPP